eukprot:COSAG02_NODE_32352_length_517_cov_4.889952_1_plen_26_part_01
MFVSDGEPDMNVLDPPSASSRRAGRH